jgi:hypothetical protein
VSSGDFRLAVIVLAHSQPEQLAALLRSLQHPRISVYLHLDVNCEAEVFRQALETAGVEDVVWLERQRTRWASITLVDVTVDALRRTLADGCDYMMLISGQDYPLRTSEELVAFAQTNRARSYVSSWALPFDGWELGGQLRTDCYFYSVFGRRYTCLPRGFDTSGLNFKGQVLNWALRARSSLRPRRRFPSYLTAHGGEFWLNLSADAAAYVVEFLERHPDYRQYHEFTWCPDELFLQSILLGSDYSQTHEVVNDDLRFLIWPEGSSHPKTLTLDDRPAMFAGTDLFARKVKAHEQPELFAELQARISPS